MSRTIKIRENPLPLVFVCPLTNRYIVDPVRVNGSGQLYEREAIESHILRFGMTPTDPVNPVEQVSINDLIRDEPLFVVIERTLKDSSGKESIPTHYSFPNVQKYLKVLQWFRNPTRTFLDIEDDFLQPSDEENDTEEEEEEEEEIYILEEEDEDEDEDEEKEGEEEDSDFEGDYTEEGEDEDDEGDEENLEDGNMIFPRFARFPPFFRSSRSDFSRFLGRMGPLQRNLLHFAVIYLSPEHLRHFCEEFETLLWNERKTYHSIPSVHGKKQPRDIFDFLLQKDGMNRSPLEYSILYGHGMDSFEKFVVVSSFFKAEKKRKRNEYYAAKRKMRKNGEILLKSLPGRTTPYPFPQNSPSLRRRPALSCPPFSPLIPRIREEEEEEEEEEGKNDGKGGELKVGKEKKRIKSPVVISKRMSFLDPCFSCFMKVQKSEKLDRLSTARYQSCAANCAKLGDRDGLLLLFRLGIRPNDKFETLFHLEVAAGFENVEMLEFMLSYSQYLHNEGEMKEDDMKNACDDAFTASAANGLIDPAKALIRYGVVDVNQKCKNFRRYCSFSLSAASFYGHVDFVLFLLSLHESKKVSLDLDQVFLGSCALNAACSTTDPEKEIVKLLLDHGCTPNPDLTKVCESPLMISAKRNHISLMKMLIAKGARVNDQSLNKRNSALHLAVIYRNYEAIKLLVKKYASLDILNSDGRTSRMLIQEDENMKKWVDRVIQKRARRERVRRKKGGEGGESGIPQQIQSLKEIIFSQQKKIEKQKNQIQGFKKMISNFVSEN